MYNTALSQLVFLERISNVLINLELQQLMGRLTINHYDDSKGRSVLTQKFCRTSTKKMLYFHKNLKMTKINESRDQKFFMKKIRNN
jgi:hypothetical protein